MENIKLMNMCKIIDNQTGKVLVQERVKSWQGIAFPGGKVKPGESIVLSVKREILEETGLKLNKIKICGIKDWYYEGNLLSETSEGKVYWIDEEELKNKKLADDFEKLLKLFNDDKVNEMIYIDNENENENERWDLYFY